MPIEKINPIKPKRIDPDKIRENLALDRTILANERTILAYVRSSLYLLIGGIALLQLKDFEELKWLGAVSLVLCVLLLGIGIFRFILLRKRLKKYFKAMNKTEETW